MSRWEFIAQSNAFFLLKNEKFFIHKSHKQKQKQDPCGHYQRTQSVSQTTISVACVEPALWDIKSECVYVSESICIWFERCCTVAISDIHLLNLPARDLSSRLHNTELACMSYFVSKFSKISKLFGNRKPNLLQGNTLVSQRKSR